MRKSLLIAAILLLPFFVSAQNSQAYLISGNVADSVSVPIYGAVVQLFQPADNTPVNSVITDSKGLFVFHNVPAGDYLLTVKHITYQSRTLPFRATGNTQIPEIRLAENVVALEMVGVSASRQKSINARNRIYHYRKNNIIE